MNNFLCFKKILQNFTTFIKLLTRNEYFAAKQQLEFITNLMIYQVILCFNILQTSHLKFYTYNYMHIFCSVEFD